MKCWEKWARRAASGSCRKGNSAVWVDCIVSLLFSLTEMPCYVGTLLTQGLSGPMKWLVQPESTMAWRLTDGLRAGTKVLPFPQLPLAARRVHVFPSLQNKALLSIVQFCDSNFTAVFHDGQVKLSNDDTTITGQQETITGLYYIDIPETPPVSPPSTSPLCLQRI